jgi:hypothetical protein
VPAKNPSSNEFVAAIALNQAPDGNGSQLTVSTTYPNDSDINIPIRPSMTVTFSKSLDFSSLSTTSSSSSSSDGSCSGSIHFGKVGLEDCIPVEIILDSQIANRVVLKPFQQLQYGASYELYLTTNIKDNTGNPLSSAKRIKFRIVESSNIYPTYALSTTAIPTGIDFPLTFSIDPNGSGKSVRSVTVTFSASVGTRPKYNGLDNYSVEYFAERPDVRREFSLNPGLFTSSLLNASVFQTGLQWGFGISTVFHDGSRDTGAITVPLVRNIPNVAGSIYSIKLLGFTDDWVPASHEFQNIGDWRVWLRITYPDSGITFDTSKQDLSYSTHVLVRPPYGDTREEILILFDSDGDGIPNYQKNVPTSISFNESIYGARSMFYVFYGNVANGVMDLTLE